MTGQFDLLEINHKQLNGEACIVPAYVTTQIKLVCFNFFDHYFPALKEHMCLVWNKLWWSELL